MGLEKILKTIEKTFKINVRQARPEDAPKIGWLVYADVFSEIWESESPELETERWRSRIKTFPEAVWVSEDTRTGQIVGAAACQIINWSYGQQVRQWVELTDNGTIKNTHNPNGNTLHIVTCVAHRNYAGLGIGSAQLEMQKNLCEKLSLRYMIVGHTVGRATPEEFLRYKKFMGRELATAPYRDIEAKIKEWAEAKDERGLPKDIVTRFYHKAGMRLAIVLDNFEGYSEYNHCILQAYENPKSILP